MKHLSFYPVTNVHVFAKPAAQPAYTLQSPALDFFTDFEQREPLTVSPSTPAAEVQKLMMQSHVRLMFVVNEKGEFTGVVGADSLESILVQKVSEGMNRQDITVADLMVDRSQLQALDYEEVSKATIEEVIQALKDHGRRHYMVIDSKNQKIRGIFSASDISRKLHLPINVQDKSDFYRVFSAVAVGAR